MQFTSHGILISLVCSAVIFMKKIQLSKGCEALVDDEDYEVLNKFKWHAATGHRTMYAKGIVTMDKYRVLVTMHRFVMNAYDSDMVVDHIDGNGLNNQRSNLRLATVSQNNANRRKKLVTTSVYKGVHKSISKGRVYWQAICKKGGKRYVRTCKTEEEAAMVYNQIATELHGEFAKLNIISQVHNQTGELIDWLPCYF